VARRNSKDVRYSAMSQRDIRKLEKKKKKANPKYDGKDWTDRVLHKVKGE
jgi:hypothetical protein